ncbi:MarR family transcriptional regulator [Leuconostoc falkenbergense]|uniref:MarR family winged helix-turn-helix transcriptional regulator n=1 Tax=Leuconostoc falkenbergense TaxID=2766470 RepID=UPI0024AD513B|nr:MarR family transcriptional regulator [Leuconostoc falkenbergense]MDI6666733.1 MarR family transcriptional regulator [Leuconostoc falkenbergense]
MDKQIISDIRRFNRFYATIIGILDSTISNTEYTITEARVLFEIQEKNKQMIASDLVSKLNIDRSYMSRIIRKLTSEDLIVKTKSSSDSRINTLHITDKGNDILNHINDQTDKQIEQFFGNLTKNDLNIIRNHMNEIYEVFKQR